MSIYIDKRRETFAGLIRATVGFKNQVTALVDNVSVFERVVRLKTQERLESVTYLVVRLDS
jgi:hypothetical protein